MTRTTDDEPRSSRLSRGPSDLWLLFAALAFGVIIMIVPAAGPWIMRAGLALVAILLLRYIRSVRQLMIAGDWTPSSSSGGMMGNVVAFGVLGFWIWYLARGFLAGKWIDAGIMSILVVEVTYLEWLKSRHGRAASGRVKRGRRRAGR